MYAVTTANLNLFYEDLRINCVNLVHVLQIDGFRFDLMGHIMKRTMVSI